MFTGLIEEVGKIATIKKQNQGAVISVNCRKINEGIKNGDSVALDGACQTVTQVDDNGFTVDASAETLELTILKDYKQGQHINLERAMAANGRFGGHMVTGHVEGTGSFLGKEKQGLAYIFQFKAPDNIMDYIVYKGSVCVNGISLTVANIENNNFSTSIIPATIEQTNLKYLAPGDKINLEPDILAKYVEKFIGRYNNMTGNINENFLKEHGFY